MSRSYRLRIAVTDIFVDQVKGVVLDIPLVPVLDAGRMAELLTEVLVRRGARREDGLLVIDRPSGVQLRVDPDARTVELGFDQLENREIEVWVQEEELALARISKREGDQLDLEQARQLAWSGGAVESEIVRQRAEARRLLLEESQEARLEINRALKDVYARAVRERADQLGNVTSLSESEQDGTYRLRIELEA
ncbi:MAG: hypothetical protein QNK04_26505 [Myxococcota bacterium]|nr:hypothetical protein [Myxococcota bacterium]